MGERIPLPLSSPPTPLQKQRDLAAYGILQLKAANRLLAAESEQLRLVGSQLRSMQWLFGTILMVCMTLGLWFAVTSSHLKKKYAGLISMVDGAVQSLKYVGPSGLATAWAFEYGRLASWWNGYDDVNLPVAIFYAYYTADYNNLLFVATPDGKSADENAIEALSTLKSIIQNSADGDVMPLAAICATIRRLRGTAPPECRLQCNIHDVQTTEGIMSAYIGAATAGAMQGGMIGITLAKLGTTAASKAASQAAVTAAEGAAQSAGAAATAMPVVGALVGVGMFAFNIFQASKSISSKQKSCALSQQNCVHIPGVTCMLK